MTFAPDQQSRTHRLWAAIFLALTLLHVLASRLSWADIPLQTDAGMWAYIGGRILDGATIYRDLWDNKPPGIFYAFAAVQSIFGRGNDTPLLWMDAVVSLIVFALTYVAARRFARPHVAAAAVLLLSLVFNHRIVADWGNNAEKFVAVFEMLGLLLALRAVSKSCPRTWFAVGLCCAAAAMFKQTGIVLLAAAILTLSWHLASRATIRTRSVSDGPATTPPETHTGNSSKPSPSPDHQITNSPDHSKRATASSSAEREQPFACATRLAALAAGFAIPWLIAAALMLRAHNLTQFWQQVVLFDFTRVSSPDIDGPRLLDPNHWRAVLDAFRVCLILFGPALLALTIAVINSLRRQAVINSPPYHGGARAGVVRRIDPTDPTTAKPLPTLLLLYAALTLLVFPIAPYGFSHYLLQAAPPAAVVAAWGWTRMSHSRHAKSLHLAVAALILLGAFQLGDHARFTLSRDHRMNTVNYGIIESRVRALTDIARARSNPDDTVMLWPTADMVNFYAQRETPLEFGRTIEIFAGRLDRLEPPMPELIAHITENPPTIILDYAPIGPFAIAHDPPPASQQFAMNQALTPLREWVRANYHTTEQIGPVHVLTRISNQRLKREKPNQSRARKEAVTARTRDPQRLSEKAAHDQSRGL